MKKQYYEKDMLFFSLQKKPILVLLIKNKNEIKYEKNQNQVILLRTILRIKRADSGHIALITKPYTVLVSIHFLFILLSVISLLHSNTHTLGGGATMNIEGR